MRGRKFSAPGRSNLRAGPLPNAIRTGRRRVTIDRGPGPASQIGYAPFGGTMSLQSLELSETRGASVFGSYGNFNTYTLGASAQSGYDKDTQSKGLIAFSRIHTDGVLKYGDNSSTQALIKFEKKFGDMKVTALATGGSELYNNANSITWAQWQTYGKNYGELNKNLTLSPAGLFIQAGPVGKTVIVLLGIASVWCWFQIFDGTIALVRLGRALAAARANLPTRLLDPVVGAGIRAAHAGGHDGRPVTRVDPWNVLVPHCLFRCSVAFGRARSRGGRRAAE